MKYDLAALALAGRPQRRGTQVLLPAVRGSASTRVQYLAALRVMLQGSNKYVREHILPEVERSKLYDGQAVLADIDENLFERFRSFVSQLTRIASRSVNSILRLEARRRDQKFMDAARKTLGVDLAAVIRMEDLTQLLEIASIRNASLITNLGEDVVNRVAQVVSTALTSGTSVKGLKKALVEQFGFTDRRAQFIALDQTAKWQADLQEFRDVQTGIEEYIWRTSEDERVRPLHSYCDGRTYRYGEPTDAEGGLPPGKPVRCRCYAQAVVTFPGFKLRERRNRK